MASVEKIRLKTAESAVDSAQAAIDLIAILGERRWEEVPKNVDKQRFMVNIQRLKTI